MSRLSVAAVAFVAALAAVPALAAPGAPGHGHETFAAGEPGNPKKPARVVSITMRESDGKMMFVPDRIEIKRGEQIRFKLNNIGELDHEFIIDSTPNNIKHAKEMEHDAPNARRLKPKAADELVWRFTKRGTFEYGCLIPGHREAGMTGTIVVK